MPGSELGPDAYNKVDCAAICLGARDGMPGTHLCRYRGWMLCYLPRHSPRDAWYSPSACCYQAKSTPPLSTANLSPPPHVGDGRLAPYAGATQCPVLRWHMAVPARGAICLRAAYAMPGTDKAYGATRPTRGLLASSWYAPPLAICYALCGTEMA
eukprot:3531064-Rhodomonas_salina.2